MTIQRLFVPGPIPGMNEVLDSKGNSFRGGYNGYAKLKKKWGGLVGLLAASQGLKPIKSGYFTYLCLERNKQRDPSNVACGAVKIIEDALQDVGLLENDGWGQVLGFVPYLHVNAVSPGVTLFVHPERLLSRDEAIELDEKARSKSCRKQAAV